MNNNKTKTVFSRLSKVKTFGTNQQLSSLSYLIWRLFILAWMSCLLGPFRTLPVLGRFGGDFFSTVCLPVCPSARRVSRSVSKVGSPSIYVLILKFNSRQPDRQTDTSRGRETDTHTHTHTHSFNKQTIKFNVIIIIPNQEPKFTYFETGES